MLVKITGNPILSGKYYITVGIYDGPKGKINYEHYNGMLKSNFFLIKNDKDGGIVKVSRSWR